MKREDLYNYIGDVDARFIEELFEDEFAERQSTVPKKRRNLRLIAASLAIILIGTAAMLTSFVGTGFGFVGVNDNRIQLGMTTNSIVMLDVNPSIMFEVNDRDVVVKYEALNDDAKKLKCDLNVVGKNCDDAIDLTLKVLNEKGYLTELKNSVLITVVDENAERAGALRKDIVDNVSRESSALDLTLSILSMVLDDGTKYIDEASKYDVSVGKIALIKGIIETNKTDKSLKIDKLVGSSIQLINQLLTYVDVPKDVDRVGSAAGVVPDDQRKDAGVDEMDGDQLVNFLGALSDFFSKLSETYGEKDVANNEGYDLKVEKNTDKTGSDVWSLVANSSSGTQGAVINTNESRVGEYYIDKDAEKVLSIIDAILGNDQKDDKGTKETNKGTAKTTTETTKTTKTEKTA